ncbi:isochorismatase family cysteine hydrolase [Halobacillus sp. ACCC02827]|uniref:cysteine hydrolase family protein n=1 Tax=Halobacillus sp. ACCC02827 TaxID=3052090 RepID=UPI0025700CBC|nr:isochorismatase family cysteine hydrolase [Halobacillus sp. ACCC02827]WJE15550.1 isochorismatase family cysteine hydrolase [Halobacillus sp. ACCC02827]
MDRALLIIDYTNDFVADNGALTCGKPGQEIEGYVTDLTTSFLKKKEFVIFGVDLHEKDDIYHPETKLFPPHNIRGTKGRELYGRLAEVYESAKASPFTYWMDKTRYSAFAGTDLDMQLRARGIQELHLVGVCTDICVLHTAMDAYNYGYDIHIHQQGVASFNNVGHDFALKHFEQTLGAVLH